MSILPPLLCPICTDYLLHPLTPQCGHSFCQLCFHEHILISILCPLCSSPLCSATSLPPSSLSLTSFIQSFIASEHQQYAAEYKKRAQNLVSYRDGRYLKNCISGQKVDVRDLQWKWKQGRILRIISKVGEQTKYVKVHYLQQENEEEFRIGSERLAGFGFYTSRDDLASKGEGKEQ